MIDVIIPAYNAHEVIENALYSISTQSITNLLNVYLVDDCSDKNYNKIVKKFSKLLNIVELKTPHNVGPGGARQYGIDNSNGEYIVFIDADDIFNDCCSIEKLYNAISNIGCNFVSSNFNVEEEDCFIQKRDFSTWMHGKIYRRSFLIQHNIRFNNTRSNEDSGFNELVSLIEDGYHIEDYTYIWRLNIDSITRKNNREFRFYGLEGYSYNMAWAISEAEKRSANPYKMAECAFYCFVTMYVEYLRNYDNKDRDCNKILEWSKELKEYYLKYNDLLDEVAKNELICSIFSSLSTHIYRLDMMKILNSKVTFDEFIELIK